MARSTGRRASFPTMRASSLLALVACSGRDADPHPPPVDGPVWRDRAVADNVLARAFDRAEDVPGRVLCTSADDPSEVHYVHGQGEIVLYGLLADTRYDCVLSSGRAHEDRSFRTEPLPDWLPTWTLPVAGDAGGAYTLLNHGTDRRGDRQAKLLVVDPEGRLRWYFSVPYDAADLDVTYLGDGRFLYGGGFSAPPTILDLGGRASADAPPLESPHDYHHDTEMLPSGEVMGLSESQNTDGTTTWTGARVDRFDPALSMSTWSWDTQRAVDEGWLPVPTTDVDPYHTNSMQVVGDQLYVNFRQRSIVARIDMPTGDLVWRLGPDGDFALVDDQGEPADDSGWFVGPHAPEHDGDRILFYDNGGRGNWRSRALELELDEDARTARVVWEFTEDGWYESIWGDVDRLADGHVLITRAHCTRCQPNSDARTQLVEVDPATDEVVWRLVFDDPEDAGYRAERIDGCAIFANEKYCPE